MIIVTDWRMDYQQYVCIYILIYIYVHVFQIFDNVLFVHIIIFIMIDTRRVFFECEGGESAVQYFLVYTKLHSL